MGGQHDDRHIRLATQRPADVEAIHLRQIEVKHDQVRLGLTRYRQRGFAVAGSYHAKVPVLEVVARLLHNLRFVVYKKDELVHKRVCNMDCIFALTRHSTCPRDL